MVRKKHNRIGLNEASLFCANKVFFTLQRSNLSRVDPLEKQACHPNHLHLNSLDQVRSVFSGWQSLHVLQVPFWCHFVFRNGEVPLVVWFTFKSKMLAYIQLSRWRERRPFVISASGSLYLVDLHGVGGLAGTIMDQSRDRGSISYHHCSFFTQIAADVKKHLLASLC